MTARTTTTHRPAILLATAIACLAWPSVLLAGDGNCFTLPKARCASRQGE